MRQFRTGTLMLLIVIAALVIALMMEGQRERDRSARPEGQSPKHTLYKVVINLFRKRHAKPNGGGRPSAVGTRKSGEGYGRLPDPLGVGR